MLCPGPIQTLCFSVKICQYSTEVFQCANKPISITNSCLFQDETRDVEYEQLIIDQRCWTKEESPTINLVKIKLIF